MRAVGDGANPRPPVPRRAAPRRGQRSSYERYSSFYPHRSTSLQFVFTRVRK